MRKKLRILGGQELIECKKITKSYDLHLTKINLKVAFMDILSAFSLAMCIKMVQNQGN